MIFFKMFRGKKKEKAPPIIKMGKVISFIDFEKIEAAMTLINYKIKKVEYECYKIYRDDEPILRLRSWGQFGNYHVTSLVDELSEKTAIELALKIEENLCNRFQLEIESGEQMRAKEIEEEKKKEEYRKNNFVSDLFKEFN